MATDQATKWIIGIVIYFVILFSFMSMIAKFSDDYHLEEGGIISSSGGGYAGYTTGSCKGPRLLRDPTGEFSDKVIFSNEIRCSRFGYYLNETECNYLEGCSWEVATHWFSPDTEECTGTLNTTYYEPEDDTTIVCNWANQDAFSCEYVGCVWSNSTSDAFDTSDTSGFFRGFFRVAETIGNVLTLRFNFSTGSVGANALLTFFLIWIPLAILIMSGYIMVRG